MLEDAITGKPITCVPYEDEFRAKRKRMSPDEDEALVAEIRSKLDATAVGKAIAAGWIAGGKWAGTAFMPVYEKVCRYDEEASALFYGIFFMNVVIEHPSLWRRVKLERQKSESESIEYAMYWRTN